MREVQRPTSLDELCRIAEQISEKHEKNDNRRTIRVYEKLSNAREAMRPFDKLLEGICELSPAGGKLIWGAVRFAFQLVEDNQTCFTAVLEFFADIGQKLAIVETELQSFHDSQLVTTAARKMFAVLIEFWVQAIKTYRTLHFGLLNPARLPLKLKFERLQRELDSQIKFMRDAANA